MRADGIPAANAFTCSVVLSESAACASLTESTPARGLACGTAKTSRCRSFVVVSNCPAVP
jgi:hypothetical protein